MLAKLVSEASISSQILSNASRTFNIRNVPSFNDQEKCVKLTGESIAIFLTN